MIERYVCKFKSRNRPRVIGEEDQRKEESRDKNVGQFEENNT